jgi:hypothetical protein
MLKYLFLHEIVVYLQRVFHSIRFKVNRVAAATHFFCSLVIRDRNIEDKGYKRLSYNLCFLEIIEVTPEIRLFRFTKPVSG